MKGLPRESNGGAEVISQSQRRGSCEEAHRLHSIDIFSIGGDPNKKKKGGWRCYGQLDINEHFDFSLSTATCIN